MARSERACMVNPTITACRLRLLTTSTRHLQQMLGASVRPHCTNALADLVTTVDQHLEPLRTIAPQQALAALVVSQTRSDASKVTLVKAPMANSKAVSQEPAKIH